MNITVEYFAQFRDLANCAGEVRQTLAESVSDLYQEVAQSHQFNLPIDDLKVAVNEEFADWNYQLKDGDTVVFIPPVAGG